MGAGSQDVWKPERVSNDPFIIHEPDQQFTRQQHLRSASMGSFPGAGIMLSGRCSHEGHTNLEVHSDWSTDARQHSGLPVYERAYRTMSHAKRRPFLFLCCAFLRGSIPNAWSESGSNRRSLSLLSSNKSEADAHRVSNW